MLEPLVPAYKGASGDIDNLGFLEHIASKGKPGILSCGTYPDYSVIKDAVYQFRGKAAIMHCVSEYPTSTRHADLGRIEVMQLWDIAPVVGYSDHTPGFLACLAAVAMGARIIEKHFTDDIPPEGYRDYLCSNTPAIMRYLVEATRRLETMMHMPQDTSFRETMQHELHRSLYEIDGQLRALRPGDMGMPVRGE
mgnify:FL=1